MDRIFFENIRCFATRQEARLAPLTVLVGENSSGKSTFLALVRIAWDLARWRTIEFNEEPFLLGSFEQIKSGIRELTPEFSIGLQVDLGSKGRNVSVQGHFGNEFGAIPFLRRWVFDSSPFLFEATGLSLQWKVSLEGPRGHEEFPVWTEYPDYDLLTFAWRETWRGRTAEQEELHQRLERLKILLGQRPYAFAPTRTKPKRTYDPIQWKETPEGAHTPMVLASVPLEDNDKAKSLFSALASFGDHAGLFDRVAVRRLGEAASDPFQIQIYIGGKARNLIDVGYGVSQVLPIVVDCLRGEKGGTFLLQQPEVHLHPSAQAELGSFLGVLAKQQEKRFVIETHSDYLVDRIRMDIRDGKGLKPDDVSLLYFERTNGKAQIHALELDEQGNILEPPPGYRRFFLEEERRLLGI